MILKALYEYYNRDQNRIPYGWMMTSLSFIIVIDQKGRFIRVEDSRDEDGKGKRFLVPKGEHTNAVTPLLFWDNMMYALDLAVKPAEHKKHLAFVERCEQVANHFKNPSLDAVVSFYKNKELEKVYYDPLWEQMKSNSKSGVSFRIHGSPNIILEEDVFDDIVKWEDCQARTECLKSVCLITGKKSEIIRVGTKTPIPGCQSSSKLVSFQEENGFDSYGKTQGGNAPISLEAEFAYSTAFLKLNGNGSRNKFRIGDRTYLFWASNDNEASKQVEDSIFKLFGFTEEEIDDPNKGIEQVRKVFDAIYSGDLKTNLDDIFYILGLAPNSGRIAVVYWAEIPLKDFAERISRHFKDMEISGANKPYMALRSILCAVTLGGKSTDATPNLPDALVKSIFQGTPYPYTLYATCIRRIRAETSKDKYDEARKRGFITTRAAIIKAYLNRLNNINEQNIKVMLDKNNINPGYLCGRLFAVLDKIQEDANNQHTIRERYLNSASATPSAVFATILNLSSHHSEKLNEGRNIFYEKLKQEIIEKLDADGFPAHLDLQDQGRFFVGYYHQRQDLFAKNEKDNNNINQ